MVNKKVTSSKNHILFQTRMHKPYPISDQNGQNLYPILDQNGQNLYFGPKWLENHTVWQCTNLSTAVAVYKGYPPSPTPHSRALDHQCSYQQYINSTHLYAYIERDNVEQRFLPKETTRWQRPGFGPSTLGFVVHHANHYNITTSQQYKQRNTIFT